MAKEEWLGSLLTKPELGVPDMNSSLKFIDLWNAFYAIKGEQSASEFQRNCFSPLIFGLSPLTQSTLCFQFGIHP